MPENPPRARPTPAGTSLERYRARLPPVDGSLLTLGEGDTPVIRLERLGDRIGLPHLRAKLEGTNPTGSYKDRVAALSLSLALADGKRGWVATSSGNAGTALAAYGARAGLPGFLCVVDSIPREKLLPAQALGATVVRVHGVGTGGSATAEQQMFAAVQDAAERFDLFLGITAHRFNPAGMRGADTIGYELAELSEPPDHVYVPTGGGGLATAVARGLSDCATTSRMIVAQPIGCAPIVDYLDGERPEPLIDVCTTVVSGLQLPSPPDGELAAEGARHTGGWGTKVPDEAIFTAHRSLAEVEGVFVEPAAATGLAAAIADRRSGRLSRDDRVVLLLTSTGMKDLSGIEARMQAPPSHPPSEIGHAIASWLGGVGAVVES